MNIKKLAKELKSLYWKYDQRLTVDTFEDRNDKPEEYYFADVCLYDPIKKELSKWLFTVQNYKGFYDIERDNGGNIFDVFDTIRVACHPYYMNGEFFIRKWTPITDEDIYDCTQYFVKKVLGLRWSIWNIEVRKHEPENASYSEEELHEADMVMKDIERDCQEWK